MFSQNCAAASVGDDIVFSNTNFVGASGYSINQGSYGPFNLLVPSSASLPTGSVLALQSITLARRDGYTDQKAVLSVGSATDAARASTGLKISDSPNFGGKTGLTYSYNNLEIVVGTQYSLYNLNMAGGGATGNKINVHVITCNPDYSVVNIGDASWCTLYEVRAKVVSIPVSYTATVTADTAWSQIVWNPARPSEGFDSGSVLEILATGTPTITFDELTTCGQLNISGDVKLVAADSIYENGCWIKELVKAGGVSATGAVTFGDVMGGFVGAYGLTSTAVTLRAQNNEVISINFANGNSVSGADYAGLAPVQGNTWMNMTDTWSGGEQTVLLSDFVATVNGQSTIARSGVSGSCRAANTYGWTGATDVFLKGYLDDGLNHAQVSVEGLPYSSYDVIVYAATDSAGYKFAPVTVNGVTYTYDATAPDTAKTGSDSWGEARGLVASYGRNAIRIRGLKSASLSIVGGANSGGARGGIAAIQIVCTGTIESVHHFTANVGSSVSFSDIVWNEGPFEAGVLTTAAVTVTDASVGEVVITFDNPDIAMASFSVISSRDVRLAASSVLSAVGSVDVSRCSGTVTYAYPVREIASSTAANLVRYAGGAGTEASHVKISHLGGSLNLTGGTFYLAQSTSGEATSVNITDSRLEYSDVMGIGTATYTLDGNAAVNTPSLVLSQDAVDRTAVLSLQGTSSIVVTGTSVADANSNSVLFGHWNGSSTFTMEEGTSFSAEGTQVLVGRTGNTQTININGGTFRSLGIRASANAGGTNVLNLNGGELFLGEYGISSYGSSFITVNVGGNVKITSTAATKLTQPLVIDAGTTLTLDASAGDILLSGAMSNAGTIKVIGGNVTIVGADPAGSYVTEGSGSISYGYHVDINSCGRCPIPAGKAWQDMKLFDAAGNTVEVTGHDDNYVYFEWKITDKACWWDYEFDGNGNNTGTDTAALSWDNPHPCQGNEYTDDGELRIPARPWRSVGSWPQVATFVMFGSMVGADKTYQIGFGSTYTGTKYTIFLATDSVSDGTVDLCLCYEKQAPTVLCSMKVPNAQQAKHLYAFVLKTEKGKTVVNTYLDGELLQPYSHKDGVVELGSGFQIGSGFGGLAAGYANAQEEDAALLDWLRVYDVELSSEAMSEYAKRYPYISPNGTYTRTVTGTAGLWNSAEAWSNEETGEPAGVPAPNSMVKIYPSANSALKVNLPNDANYEGLVISGDGPFSIVGDDSASTAGKVHSIGRVYVGSDTTFAYDAFRMNGAPLNVADDCTVTFDMTSIDINAVWDSETYDLTGNVTTGANARVICTHREPQDGRTVVYGIDPTDGHFKFTVSMSSLVAEVSGNCSFDELRWKIGETTVIPDWSHPVLGTIKVTEDNARLTFTRDFVSAGSTLRFIGDHTITLAKSNDEVTVDGISYDFTETSARGTFAYKPDVSKVKAGYVRFDLDMGSYAYNELLLSSDGRYEFRKVTISGNGYDYHDRTVVVQDGDEVNLVDGSTIGCGLSFDVRGGNLIMGKPEGYAAITYGRNGTRFVQSGGTVTVNATGTDQKGSASGFVIAHSKTGGGIEEFVISGGLFAVTNSSVNFNEAANSIVVTGTGVLRAKGVFSAKSTSTGTISVTNGGTLEIGSLGVTATAMQSFVMNGGILRAYEDGATFAGPVLLAGNSSMTAQDDSVLYVSGVVSGSGRLTIGSGVDTGVVLLGGANTYAGGTAVVRGVARAGASTVFGNAAIDVSAGGTLDFGGYYLGNAISITGSGSNGRGALMNSGSEMTENSKLRISFAGNASIGGNNTISFGPAAELALNGNVMTISGADASSEVELRSPNLTGGGSIVVNKGIFRVGTGVTALGDVDLSITVNGTLDMSQEATLSCRDFTSAGTTFGSTATLVVNRTVDASSKVEVSRLRLADGAKLCGQGLVVTAGIEFGSLLNVEVNELKPSISIGTVPSDTSVAGTTVTVNGETGYALSRVGTTLIVSKGTGVIAEIKIADTTPWTNFEELRVSGTVKDFQGTAIGETNINIVVTAGDGTVTTQRFVYAGGGTFSSVVTGLDHGAVYDVSAFISIEGFEVHAESDVVNTMMARKEDGWIVEDAGTFTYPETGTGLWDGSDGTAEVGLWNNKRVIMFLRSDWDDFETFTPTNNTASARDSNVLEVSYKAIFSSVGLFEGESPALPKGHSTAMTMAENASGETCFAIFVDNAWKIVPRSVFAPELETEYELMMRFDRGDGKSGKVTYCVVTKSGTITLGHGACGEIASLDKFNLKFGGSGAIVKMLGVSQDSNLVKAGQQEYFDYDTARAGCGNQPIEPLWWSRYKVSDAGGEFSIRDRNNYLTLEFPSWYHWKVRDFGTYITYRYLADNNWLAYADEGGVSRDVHGIWHVTNPEGLAWISRQANGDGSFAGSVMLDADIDLSARNWTPIASFSGSFDGNGKVITGLNNTNVAYDVELGLRLAYESGITNSSGYVSYGLVGFAQDASFSNLTLRDSAIDSDADSVAALVGSHFGGDLTITSVSVGGSIYGVDGLTRAVAGLATVGGGSAQLGDILVSGNSSTATVGGIGLLCNEDGGNVAQVLAGTTWGTKFGDVDLTANSAEGEFDVYFSDVDAAIETLPVCNLAPAVQYESDADGFRMFVEANAADSVPVDPVSRTARMSAGTFRNGSPNFMGQLVDRITAAERGTTLVIDADQTDAGQITIDGWAPVFVDRDIRIDLNGCEIVTVYDSNIFHVDAGVNLSLTNGSLVVAKGYSAFSGDGGHETSDVTITVSDEDFEGRTIAKVSEFKLLPGQVCLSVSNSDPYCSYAVEFKRQLTDGWECLGEMVPGNGADLMLEVPVSSSSGFFRVKVREIQ